MEHSWAVVARPQGHSLQCDKTRESLLLTPVFARLFVYVFVQGGRLPAVSAGASCAAQASTGGGEGDEQARAGVNPMVTHHVVEAADV